MKSFTFSPMQMNTSSGIVVNKSFTCIWLLILNLEPCPHTAPEQCAFQVFRHISELFLHRSFPHLDPLSLPLVATFNPMRKSLQKKKKKRIYSHSLHTKYVFLLQPVLLSSLGITGDALNSDWGMSSSSTSESSPAKNRICQKYFFCSNIYPLLIK